MKRTIGGSAAVVLAAILLASCGGGYKAPTIPTGPPSQISKRAFVSNEFAGSLQIVNAATDALSPNTVLLGAGPQTIVVSGDKTTTLVFNAGSNTVSQVANATESSSASIPVGDYSDSLAISSDGKVGYAALRNAPSSTTTPLGVVTFLDLVAHTTSSVDVPLARRLVLSPNGNKLLVFSDNSNSVTVIDTTTKVATVVAGFDRPAWGVFSSDSTKAYIMNCGPECGGTTASVRELDNVGTTNTLGTNTPVSAATTGLLDGTNLYVAGTVSAGAGGGRLDVLTASSVTVTRSGVVINDAYHTTMAISSGHLFVGARACSNVTEGCLSVFNTSAGSAAIGAAKGEVTGMAAISGRSIVYVCEGGELRVYNSSTGAEVLPAPVDIVGKAWDVKAID